MQRKACSEERRKEKRKKKQGRTDKTKYWTKSHITELHLGKGKKSFNILFLQWFYNPLLFWLWTVEQWRMCEQISTLREVLLSKDSCPAEYFLWWRAKWHGDLYLPRWMYDTSREKHTGQSIKRETEDLYKLYFKICQKKRSVSKIQTLWIP